MAVTYNRVPSPYADMPYSNNEYYVSDTVTIATTAGDTQFVNAEPEAAPSLADINEITKRVIVPGLVDALFKDSPLMALARRGTVLREPFRYADPPEVEAAPVRIPEAPQKFERSFRFDE